jgi:hypothetical protein
MQQLEGPYVQYLNQRYQRVGGLFQGRYASRLVDAERYALALARYIHQNPVEAGVAAWPEDYPWSSYPCYIGKLPKWKWLETEWLLQLFHPAPEKAFRLFQAFHQFSPSEAELTLLRSKRPLTKNPMVSSCPP